MRRHTGARRLHLMRFAVVALVIAPAVLVPAAARADTICGPSGGHTLCVTTPPGTPPGWTLSDEVTVTVTNSPNSGSVFATWIPSGGKTTQLMEMAAPSPATSDYTFVWPTQKYLDADGTLRLQAGSTGATAVDVAATLSNGNTADFQHSPSDWAPPVAWTDPTNDPTVLAVGDGPSNEVKSNQVANLIATSDPALFLFLGDVYETGTFTEFRNHYGVSALDPPGTGTLWGATADITQPTLGNHENANKTAYTDYWHGRPLFTKFTFGGTLFLDMNSSASMSATSAQYQFVQSAVTDPSAPACIVAYWHIPAVTSNTGLTSGQTAMWSLLANNGVDLLMTAHLHKMIEFKPLDASFTAGTPQSHLVELVDGAGGHKLAGAGVSPGARVAWSKGGTAGPVALTLNGAANGGAATSIGWRFQDVNGNGLRPPGSVDCQKENRPPVVNAGPDQEIILPDQATMQGSVTDDGLPSPPNLTSTWSQVSGPGTATFADPSSPTTTVSFDNAPGTYVLRLKGDDGALQTMDDVTVTVRPEGTVVLDVPVVVGSDDAEESSAGVVSRASTDLELVVDNGDAQTVGMRFVGLGIPTGATIQEAHVQFEVDEVKTGPCSLTVQGQAADNPTTFTTATFNISSRPRTSASVGWAPAPWPTIQVHGPDQRTPDLSSVVQEIVSRVGWASGNAMVVIITGSGVRTAEAFDGTFAPILHIEYTP